MLDEGFEDNTETCSIK